MRPIGLLIVASTTVIGCAWHTVAMRPEEAVSVTRTFQTDGRITVKYQEQNRTITPEYTPRLKVRLRGLFQGDASDELGKIKVVNNKLIFPYPYDMVSVSDIKDAELNLGSYHPPEERFSKVRFGMMLAGPSILFAPVLDVRPIDVLAFDFGGLAAPEASAWGFAGMRVVVIRTGMWRPFIGAFVHGCTVSIGKAGVSDSGIGGYGGAGPRVGTEIEIAGGHLFMRIEFDVFHRLGKGRLISSGGDWLPWGGLAINP
jgi:hypothetical protein